MFDTDHDLLAWLVTLELGEESHKVIRAVRESEPAARVRSGVRNVSGRYPSRKMRRTIQFGTHRNELAAVIELEHDSDVIEYWDLPPSFKLNYRSKNGKIAGVVCSPNFFVLRQSYAEWLECRGEPELEKLSAKQPNLYLRDEGGTWVCPPGEYFASQYGFRFRVRSSAETNWIYQRNALFLEDYLRADMPELPAAIINYVQSLVTAKPGITLGRLLTASRRDGVSADSIYLMLISGKLYADLSASPLVEPDKVRLYFDRESQSLRHSTEPSPFPPRVRQQLTAGDSVRWDGKVWLVLNLGDRQTWLRDQGGEIISLENERLNNLLDNEIVEITFGGASPPESGDEFLYSSLARASNEDLAEANRRYRIITHRSDESTPTVCGRTIQRYRTAFRVAEERYGCGFVGLLPQTRARGNRQPKLPPESAGLAVEFIDTRYETLKQPTRRSVWSKLNLACRERGIITPSYQTFCQMIARRPAYTQALKRKGRRGSQKEEPFYFELEFTTPRHGDRPFEICHIDHTELDLELVHSRTGVKLGRPWFTLMVDAYSRRILAFHLTYDPPSYRSCMMVLRECVQRHHRLPQTIVVDGGLDLSSTYFETLLAVYECVQKVRPASKARFGSTCERLFGTTNTLFVYNLQGNTQLTKTNVRHVTQEVNPKKLAVWTLGDLDEMMQLFAYQTYDTMIHPALGQSPRDAFASAVTRTGARPHRYVSYNETFEMLTLPTTPKGTARVEPGRGVLINYNYYWSEGFRDPSVEGTRIPVRFDPLDLRRAYAYFHNQWRLCHSDRHVIFEGRSERELRLASQELRRQNRCRGKRYYFNAHKLGEFLTTVDSKELTLQRLRDEEMRGIRARNDSALPHSPAALPTEGPIHREDVFGKVYEKSVSTTPKHGVDLSAVKDGDLIKLKSYGE